MLSERNRTTLHSMRRMDLWWVGVRQANFVVIGPKFTDFIFRLMQ